MLDLILDYSNMSLYLTFQIDSFVHGGNMYLMGVCKYFDMFNPDHTKTQQMATAHCIGEIKDNVENMALSFIENNLHKLC